MMSQQNFTLLQALEAELLRGTILNGLRGPCSDRIEAVRRAHKRGSLFYLAIASDCSRTIEILLDYNVDINARNHRGTSPLHYASQMGKANIIKILLDNGADAEQIDHRLRRPIHSAMLGFNKRENVECLLEHGVNYDAKDGNNWTAFNYALRENYFDVARELLYRGVDISSKSSSGKTLYSMIKGNPNRSGPFKTEVGFFILKKHVAGFSVDKEDLKEFTKYIKFNASGSDNTPNSKLASHIAKFKKELAAMKDYKFYNSITLHDILYRHDPRYQSNKELVEALLSLEYEQFPEYKDWLKGKIQVDRWRYKLMVQAIDSLRRKNSHFSLLPQELIESIFCYLDCLDLRSIINSCNRL